uniref:Ragulator complex protein LAMTOR2-B n=1 Tax=Ciona intestinalis TaxID=7719 RepID=F6XCN2_CIOIN|nr:ragulator complex protein LAMTOR2-B [Ciona intestinalis]|eukprot:XP_002131755.1 ragulator complex protein LAMTOR2-B [Ciona intestinalis]
MLNPHDLTEILGQANTGGIQSTLLVNSHGALVAFSGFGDSAVRTKATISSNIWAAYEHTKHNALQEDALQCVLMACETGHVAIQRAGSSGLLLCMFADKTVGLGILKAKIECMSKFLNGPLNNITVS